MYESLHYSRYDCWKGGGGGGGGGAAKLSMKMTKSFAPANNVLSFSHQGFIG